MSLKKICVLCPDKAEDIEFLVPVDLWNRAGIQVDVYAYNREKKINLSYSKLAVECLGTVDEIKNLGEYDAVFLPGGPGWRNYLGNECLGDIKFCLKSELNRYFREKKDGYLVGICGSPIAIMRILEDKKNLTFTAYNNDDYIGDLKSKWVNKKVEMCGRFISGQNAGCSMDLGLAVIERLIGLDKVKELSERLFFDYPGIEHYVVIK